MIKNGEKFENVQGTPSERLKKVKSLRGLGDAVALVAEPIARISDKILKTELSGCKSCKERQEVMNKYLSFRRSQQ